MQLTTDPVSINIYAISSFDICMLVGLDLICIGYIDRNIP